MTDPKSKQSGLLRKDDCLLVIIDVQEKLLPVVSDHEKVLANVVKLAQFAQIMRLPVVVTEQAKLGPTVSEVSSALSSPQVFNKITFDCFGEEAFRAYLGLSGRKTLILAGIESHICVAQTALTALDNYKVQVVTDAVSSRDPHNRFVALDRLAHRGAVLTTTEMVIYEIMRRADIPEFRAVLKLVK
jgi:nicotinamidase-related amidase